MAERAATVRLFLAFFLVYAVVAVATGDYLAEADSDARLLGAREALSRPSLLLDPWHKPVLTSAVAFVLALGGGAVSVKLVQAAHAAAALALARAAAVRAGAREGDALFATALAGLAPFWVRGVSSALTETSCALFLALALWLWTRERPAPSALAASFAFLARFDAIFFWVALVPFLLRRRSFLGLACLLVAPALWHIAGWAATGDAAFLLTHQPHPWTGSIYGTGPWWTFLALLPVSAGLVLVPALLGVARAPAIAWAVVGATLVGHSILWTFGLLGSLGLPRYLLTIVPALAIGAAFGLDRLRGRRLRAGALVLATVAAAGVAAYRPTSWRGAAELASAAERAGGALTDHPTVARLMGGGWRRIDAWRDAPPGTRIAWDPTFADLGAFRENPPDRLRPETTVRVPARWPWETESAGAVFRLE